MPAIGIGRQLATEFERAAFNKGSRFPLLAEAKTFKAEKDRWAEIVVAHQRINIIGPNPRHAIGLGGDFLHFVVPEIQVKIGYGC